MKTSLTFFKPLLWKRLSDFLKAQLFSSELWQLEHCLPWVSSSTSTIISKLAAAVKDVRIGLSALSSSATTNKRIFIGLGLVGIVSPLSACLYILFDQEGFVENWYHVNNFYLFMLLGPYLAGLFLTLGVFFLFPKDAKRSYTLTVPMAYLIGKILWLYFTTSNAEYWSVPHWSFFAMGAAISLAIFFLTDWLTLRKFHRADSFDAREKGLYQIADSVDADKWKSMMMETLRQKYEFNQKY